ncbi:serine/arginine repetitive matrix protein 1-like, partial [Penaeus indicus]|uniref:serine/arginine repetitive matrix protein 1-like n=1 Tax=Penaeus indicus TaxID=29960 RepID=UPI00300CF367
MAKQEAAPLPLAKPTNNLFPPPAPTTTTTKGLAAKTPVRPTPRDRGRPRPLVQGGHTPSRGTHRPRRTAVYRSVDSPSLAASPQRPSKEAAEGRKEGPTRACLPGRQPTPPGDGGEPTTLGIPVRGREGARPPRPRSPAPAPPARQPAKRQRPPFVPIHLSPRPFRPHHPKQAALSPARTQALPALPDAREARERAARLRPATQQGEAARRQGTCCTAGPRGQEARASVRGWSKKGALPARKANGNGGKRPSAHGLPAVLPSSVRTVPLGRRGAFIPSRWPRKTRTACCGCACLLPSSANKCGHSQLAPLPAKPPPRTGKAAAAVPCRPPQTKLRQRQLPPLPRTTATPGEGGGGGGALPPASHTSTAATAQLIPLPANHATAGEGAAAAA